ncbi:hypothetical protein GCM10010289_58250 [Streptomyces violascens]|nr:hypothetical protein GCM10010289_58250 [Streptomyces violascens]
MPTGDADGGEEDPVHPPVVAFDAVRELAQDVAPFADKLVAAQPVRPPGPAGRAGRKPRSGGARPPSWAFSPRTLRVLRPAQSVDGADTVGAGSRGCDGAKLRPRWLPTVGHPNTEATRNP